MKQQLIVFTLLFGLTSWSGIAQDTPECSIIIHQQEINPRLDYLFSKYGVEFTEKICLGIEWYELEHNVIVLFDEQYHHVMDDLDEQISQSNNQVEIAELMIQQTKLINLIDVEDTIVNEINKGQ